VKFNKYLHSRTLLAVTAALALSAFAQCVAGGGKLSQRDEVRSFIDDMVTKHDFSRRELVGLMDKVKTTDSVIDAISRPAESKPWYQYRPIFITPRRIQQGVEFLKENRESLQRAEQVYGVPPEIVTAILGVETFYGRQTGGYRVIDSLATLAFDYPPRRTFFRSELEQYLLLTREEQIDPLELTGSYAGAMGQPQFIASSYRRYAVDFDGDHHRDLWHNTVDAIGSVAYYLQIHGWQRDGAIARQVSVPAAVAAPLLELGIKPRNSVADIRKLGVEVPAGIPADAKAALIALETKDEPEYWLGFDNFYVITRYNHSPLYAMAVYQLSIAIRDKSRDDSASN